MSASAEKVDFLDDDNEIPGQRFCLLSFLSPENVLEKKDNFFFTKFMENYEIQWKTTNFEKYLAETIKSINDKLNAEADRLAAADCSGASEICRQARLNIGEYIEDFQAYQQKNKKEITTTVIKEKYDDFIYVHGKKVEDEFFAKNNFQTTVRGLKVRGSYSSDGEARARAQKLQKADPLHNIYVAEVGKWLAWDPKPHEIPNQEYANEQLNSLMKAYNENEAAKSEAFKQNAPLKDAVEGSRKKITDMTGGAGGDMFGTFGYLALQRKMENAGK